MRSRKFVSEFSLNMDATYVLQLQQGDLPGLQRKDYPPFHIYFVGRRPRITLDPESFRFSSSRVNGTFWIQRQDRREPINIDVPNRLGTADVEMLSQYPFSEFEIKGADGTHLSGGKSSLLLASACPSMFEYFDFEVLYIGQSYGVEGSRTAPERLASHSTLQGIYAEAQRRTPDQEIWITLVSFEEWLLATFDGRKDQTIETTIEQDDEHVDEVLSRAGSDQLNINFTEASLIRYFQPEYNRLFKDTFPNPAHSTYAQCYEVDLHSVGVQISTEAVRFRMWSHVVPPEWIHLPQFELHSREERRSMFDFWGDPGISTPRLT